MTDRLELPTSHRRRATVYDVLPDVADMTWTIWDQGGCLGEISSADGGWFWRHNSSDDPSPAHATWQEATDELIAALPDLRFD